MSGILDYFFGQAEQTPERKKFFDDARQKMDEDMYGNGRVKADPVLPYPDLPEMRRGLAVRDAAFPRVVTAPLELVNLVKQIYDATQVPDLPVHEQSDSGIVRGLEKFGRAKYGPDGFEKLIEGVAQKVHERKLAGDARSEKDIAHDFMNSPEYEAFQQQYMPTLGRVTEKAGNAIDRMLGAPIDAEKTTAEKVGTAMAQAYVPTKGLNTLVEALGGGNKAKFIADMMVPGTSTYTGKNVAINAGVSGALVGGVDIAVDKLLDDGQEDTPDHATLDQTKDETPPASQRSESILDALPSFAQYGLPALAIAAAGAAPKVANQAAHAAVKARYGAKEFVAAGDARAAKLNVSPTVRAGVDELAPVEDTLTRVTDDRAAATAATRDMTRYMRGNQAADIEHWRTSGHLEGLDRTTVSGKDFTFHRDALDQMGELPAFNEYMLAQTALDSRKAALSNVTARRDKLINDIDSLQAAGSYKKAAELEKDLIKALDEERAIRADAVEGRPSLAGKSTQELEDIVANGKLKEHFTQTEELFKRFSNDALEYGKKNGIFSDEDIARMKGANPNYIPLKEDPLGAAMGANRLAQKLKNKLGLNENPYGEDANFIRSFNPFSARELFDNTEKVNNPLNPFDAIDLYAERMIRFVNREKMKSSFIDELMRPAATAEKAALNSNSADDWAKFHDVHGKTIKEVEQFEHNGMKSFSVSQVKAMIGQGLDFSNYVSRLKNGRVEFYKFRDPLVHNALQHAPLVTIPILRDVARQFRQFTTGTANPGFAPVSFAYDTRTINLNRPMDSVYGLDYLVDKLTLGKSPDFVKTAARAVATNYDPVAYGLNMSTAISSFARQNAMRIGSKIVDDLARETGLFNTLAQIPQMKPMLQDLGETMVSAFTDSLYGTMVYNHAADAAVLTNMTNHVRDIDKLITARMPEWAKVIGHPAYEAIQQYRMMMSSIHSAAKVGYVLRNPHLFTDAAGNIVPKKLKAVMNDARTMGGDFSRKPGSKILQGFDSASPYFNVMLRSTQSLWQHMRDDPRLLGMMFTGVMMPKLYSDYMMSNWDKSAYDYYWRQMPEWKRVGTIILPAPSTLFAWMKGERVPFSRDAIVELITVPEIRPISEAVSQGVRAMGFYGAGQKDKLTGGQTIGSALSAIGEGMKQTFAPMTPPAFNAMLAPAGVQVDLGNAFQGKNPVGVRSGGAATRSGIGETMTVGSEISKSFADTISGMFGTAATRLTQAFDTGAETYKHTGSVMDAFYGAGKEFVQRTTDLREDVPLLGKATEKVYRGNPVGDHARKMREAIDVVIKRDGVSKPVGNPVLDQIANHIRIVARNNFEYKTFRKTYFSLKERLDATDANKMMSYNERLSARNDILKQMYALDVQQSKFLTEMEARIAKTMGDGYKQQFGTDFTFADFAKYIKAANRNKKGSLPN